AHLDNARVDSESYFQHTRAQAFLDTLQKDKVSAMDKYNRSRDALLRLGLSPKDKSLQPLAKSELWGRDMGIPAELGATRKEEPWFWIVGRPSGMTAAEVKDWDYEVDKARWFRYRALVDRAREEKEILEEEIHRVHTSFSKMSAVWAELAVVPDTPLGHSAYASKQSAMYTTLADGAYSTIRQFFPLVLGRISIPPSPPSS
ncbi:hypothetical protein BDN72DRAFT_866507, partial [Pluteus cervinus]